MNGLAKANTGDIFLRQKRHKSMAEKKQHWLLGAHDQIGDSNIIGIQGGKRTRSTTSKVVATARTGSAARHRHLSRSHLSIDSSGSGSGGDGSCCNTLSLSSDSSGSYGFSAECRPARTPAAAAAATGRSPCSPAYGEWVGRQRRGGGGGGGGGGGNGSNMPMFEDPSIVSVSTNSFEIRRAAAGSAAGAENLRHDSFRAIATACSCCSSGRASKGGSFPCRPSSPLSFGSVSPDPTASAAIGGGDGHDDDEHGVKNSPPPKLSSRAMIRSAAVWTSGPSASPIRSSVPAPLPVKLASNLPTARALWPVFAGPEHERFAGGGDGGGKSSSDIRWSSLPSSQSGVPAPAHATSANPAWPIPSASSSRPFSSAMPIGGGGGYLPVNERMHCDDDDEAHASDIRKIGSIEELRSGSPCSVAVNAKSPQGQISGVSGGRPNASGVKRTRSSGAISHTNDQERYGRGRKGGRRMKHSSDGDPLSSANVADDDRCPALALPSASTKTHERAYSFSGFPGERTGGPAATGGRDVGVDASSGNVLSDGGRRTDMDDVVRSFDDLAVSSHGDMPSGVSDEKMLHRTLAFRSFRHVVTATSRGGGGHEEEAGCTKSVSPVSFTGDDGNNGNTNNDNFREKAEVPSGTKNERHDRDGEYRRGGRAGDGEFEGWFDDSSSTSSTCSSSSCSSSSSTNSNVAQVWTMFRGRRGSRVMTA